MKLDVLSIAALALAHDAGSSMASSCAAFRQAARYFTPRRGATERRPIVLTRERLGENLLYPLVYANSHMKIYIFVIFWPIRAFYGPLKVLNFCEAFA